MSTRVLIVDDTDEDRAVVRRYLSSVRELSVVVDEASTGEAGLEACLSKTYDAVLLDMHLPGIDGFEVLRRLRQAGCRVPVVAMTGSGHGGSAQTTLELGAIDFLVKDEMSPVGLPRVVSNAIIRARLQRELEETGARSNSLVELTSALSKAVTPWEVVGVFLEQIMPAVSAVAGLVGLVDGDLQRLIVTDSRGYSQSHAALWSGLLELDEELPYCEAARTDELVTCSSLEERDRRYPALRGSPGDFNSFACLPLGSGGEPQGVLYISFVEERRFSPVERVFLTLLSRTCGQALLRARTQEGEKQARELLRVTAAEKEKQAEQLRLSADFEKHLIGIVSHDLKAPLHVVLLQAQILARTPGLSEHMLAGIARIERSARKGKVLIADLLDFAQSRDQGGFNITRGSFDLAELAAQSIDMQRTAFPEREFTVLTSGDLNGSWDRDRLEQVITNLTSNAVQHGAPESPVTVALREEDAFVSLEVGNRGAPIPPASIPYLFEAFRSGGGRRAQHNVGLGLFIVDQIVKAHGGSVAVASSAEDGTRFTVRLPR
jgi:signal transduction histidine kinase/DNA-binding NarL/FixJ family response regulator